jgi:hypothetical protein
MTATRRRRHRSAAFAVAGLLSACQPLPRPFADDRPPADLLAVRDSVGVAIAAIEGRPPEAAAKLGPALAGALLKHDIPASDRTTSLGSYQLYGSVAAAQAGGEKPAIVARWRLYDAGGKILGEPTIKLEAAQKDWESGDDKLVARLAAASAEAVAPLVAEEPPAIPEKPPATAQVAAVETAPPAKAAAPTETSRDDKIRLAIGEVKGAPGDGGKSLARAVVAVLKKQDLAIVDDAKKADLMLDGEVDVAGKADKQHVKIVWRMRRSDGAEIGTVGQENDVPRGLLDGAWGDVAYSIALAAGDGLMALVARGAPERKS